jgi:hypothetical protein
MARPKKSDLTPGTNIPKTKPRIRLRKNGPQTTPAAERREARKATFLEFAKRTFGNIAQAVALFNEAAQGHDRLLQSQITAWAKDDPIFSAALADCKHMIAAQLGELAINAVKVGMKRANPAMTKIALDYYVMPDHAAAANGTVAVQVNVSLADALRKADAVVVENAEPKNVPSVEPLITKIASDNVETSKLKNAISEVLSNA